MNLIHEVEQLFLQRFENNPAVYIAPGRINLIGEHVDYNDGLVMPAAIDRQVVLAAQRNFSDHFRFYSPDFKESASFTLAEVKPGSHWTNYLMGVVDGFRKRGITLEGVDVVLSSTIPIGAGLSSSAALCCGFGFALNDLFQAKQSRLEIAHIAQYAEHQFAGVKCGIMDQYASLFGVAHSALLLDCRLLMHQVVPFTSDEFELLLIDSKVKHSLAASAYNERRAACEEGVRVLNKKYPSVSSLRDVSALMLYENQEALGDDVFIKCQFVVHEIERVGKAADLLKAGDILSFGKRMFETHWGLSQSYEVSCEELDFLVSLAEEENQMVIGARMMGGGFGGCSINLVKKGKKGVFEEIVRDKYFTSFGKEPDFHAVTLTQGVHRIE